MVLTEALPDPEVSAYMRQAHAPALLVDPCISTHEASSSPSTYEPQTLNPEP